MLEAVKQKGKTSCSLNLKIACMPHPLRQSAVIYQSLERQAFVIHKNAFIYCGHTGLKAAIEQGRPLGNQRRAMPFGVNEVLVEAVLDDGTVLHYDFSSGRHFIEGSSAGDLCGDMAALRKQVVSIDFINRKMGVTTQEYDSIHILL